MKTSNILISLLVIGLIVAGVLLLRGSDPADDQAKTDLADKVYDPEYYQGENGEYEAYFPGYCAKIVTRMNEPDLFGGETWDDIVQVQYVYCDHPKIQGEGCSLTAIYNVHNEDGSMAGPDNVVLGIEDLMKKYGVRKVDQSFIKKDFGLGVVAEGVEVRARPETGNGEFLVRGLLVLGDIYLLAAWNQSGGIWDNPEYLAFFNSFRPGTE